jgi:hypothetical protein
MQLDNFRFDALAIQKQTDRKPPKSVEERRDSSRPNLASQGKLRWTRKRPSLIPWD